MTLGELLLTLLPPGAYATDEDALHVQELHAFGEAMQVGADAIEALVPEFFPGTADQTLEDWERVYGLHPGPGDDLATRRARLVALYQLQPSTAASYVAQTLSTYFGVTVSIVEDHAIYGELEYGDTWPTVALYHFGVVFDQADVVALELTVATVRALVERLKPAHTVPDIYCDPCRFDEEWGWGAGTWSA